MKNPINIQHTSEEEQEVNPVYNHGVFNWKHLNDQQLYIDNDYAVEKLKEGIDLTKDDINGHPQNDPGIIYNCYWYGSIGRKQVFSIKSFLCTQDLNHCRMILWLDIYNGFKNHEHNPLLKEILPFIEVKAYDPVIEARDTPWENNVELPNDHYDLVRRCDAFRFLILHKYGGVYFDLDVMFLKDLGSLVNSEFCYAWENQPYANSAILNLKRKSEITTYLMKKAIQKGAASPWGIFIYTDSFLKELYVLPCAFFDPIWQGLKSKNYPLYEFSNFFTPFDSTFINHLNINSYKEFFPGCYAYHWHNQWNTPEYENSFFGIFDREFSILLRDKLPSK